jgi:preprotein translocase subunit Sec63
MFILIGGVFGMVAGIAILLQVFVSWLKGESEQEYFQKHYQQQAEEVFKPFVGWVSACNLLGVNPDEACEKPELIKKAYRKMAMQYHPDKGGSAEQFNNIKKAYDYLMS